MAVMQQSDPRELRRAIARDQVRGKDQDPVIEHWMTVSASSWQSAPTTEEPTPTSAPRPKRKRAPKSPPASEESA